MGGTPAGQGLTSRIGVSLAQPTQNMTWLQLGASAIFVAAVLMMWRQVVRWGMNEI